MRNDFFEHCFKIQGLQFITPSKAFPFLQEGVLMIDLRPDYEAAGKIPDIPKLMHIPYTEIDQFIADIPHDEVVLLADAVGIRSKEVMITLRKHGYENLVSLAGGLFDWEREGFPLIVDLRERLTGSCMCQLKPRDRMKLKNKKADQ